MTGRKKIRERLKEKNELEKMVDTNVKMNTRKDKHVNEDRKRE